MTKPKQTPPEARSKSRTIKTQDERRALNRPYALRIRQFRKAAGLQQQELASRMGIRANAVSNWETGLSRPDLGDIPLLCSILGISADDFFGVSGGRLSLEDRQLLAQFHALDAHGQAVTRRLMDAEQDYAHSRQQARYDAGVDVRCYHTAAAAGYGTYLPEDEDYETLRLDCTPDTCRADYLVPVSGDSMEPTYHSGDLLLVRRTASLQPGQVGVFVFDGEGYVKELGDGCLKSHNPAYQPIALGMDQPVSCLGQVLGILDPALIVA